MQVNKTPGDIARTEAAQRAAHTAAPAAPQSVDGVSEARRVDEVQISEAGRALAHTDAQSADTASPVLDPERIDDIRSKVLSGAYSSLEMADHVARAILRSGDL